MADQSLTRQTRTVIALIAASITLGACGTDGTPIEAQGPAQDLTTATSDAIEPTVDQPTPSLACEGKGLRTPVIAADALATLANFDGFVPYGFASYQQLRDYSDTVVEATLVDVREIAARRNEGDVHLDGSIEVDFEVVEVLGGREQPVSNPDAPAADRITVALPLTLEEPYASEQLKVLAELIDRGRFVLFLDRRITGGIAEEQFTNLYLPSTLLNGALSAMLFEEEESGRLVRLVPQNVSADAATGVPTSALRCTPGAGPEGRDIASGIALLRSEVGSISTPRPTGAYEITENRRAAAIEAAL